MDHDAGSTIPLTPADADPPICTRFVKITGLAGGGAVAIAALFGIVSSSLGENSLEILNGCRLFLVFVGVVVVGSAISMRPNLWWTWGIGAIASVLAVFGLPDTWDSFQIFFRVVAVVASAGTAFCLFSPKWRFAFASAILLFHFTGIFMATTAPPSTPWLTEQLFRRTYNPYLQFLYLRNAYHFYSPEPGPASVLVFLLKTETGRIDATGKKEYATKWVISPTRPANIRDPLGLGYYRLLSINEQTARGSVGLANPTEQFEKTEMYSRRYSMMFRIPYHPTDPQLIQYKLPNSDVARYILPSYASHVIVWNTPDKETAARTTVKIYRLEHRDLSGDRMAGGDLPYHPSTYRPYFLGEFDALGNLIDPREVFLYWMIPIIQSQSQPLPDVEGNPYKKSYHDYLSVHALDMPLNDVLKANVNDGKVFNWSLLR
ncbi:MAG TPA: hypothetical protein VG097_04350 [Gemmata sp.]|jgi:hypothetical protein|nr:hypothetical protein [Gemmata sp.]